ncbi:hypothetical protein [Streptomyces sp. NPDC007905]
MPGGALRLRVPGPFLVSVLVTDGGGQVGGGAGITGGGRAGVCGAQLSSG